MTVGENVGADSNQENFQLVVSKLPERNPELPYRGAKNRVKKH
jgi:hypothetical protein